MHCHVTEFVCWSGACGGFIRQTCSLRHQGILCKIHDCCGKQFMKSMHGLQAILVAARPHMLRVSGTSQLSIPSRAPGFKGCCGTAHLPPVLCWTSDKQVALLTSSPALLKVMQDCDLRQWSAWLDDNASDIIWHARQVQSCDRSCHVRLDCVSAWVSNWAARFLAILTRDRALVFYSLVQSVGAYYNTVCQSLVTYTNLSCSVHMNDQ